MNEVLSALTMWLTDVLVLGTTLLAASVLLLIMLRQPEARMALARGTRLGLAMLCVLTALPFWPRQPLADVVSRGAVEQETAEPLLLPPAGAVYPSPLVVEAPLSSGDSLPSAAPVSPSLSIAKLITLLPLFWLGAAGFACAYILLGAWRAFRLLHCAVKAPAWSQQELERLVSPKNRTPRLKTSERIATAVALLAWRPHILLAAKSVREDNQAAVRAALAHEWAHIRHGDLWLLALERLLLPVFCLHPLFWLLRRQVRIDQELLADAAAAGDTPVEYAQALLSWAKVESAVAAPGFGIAALSLWEHPSSLSRRVEMLLHPKPSASAGTSRLWRWLAPLSLLVAVLGLSLITLRPAAVAQDNVVVEVQARPEKIKKAKKEKPKKSEAKRTAADNSPQPVATGDIILMEILVGQVEHAALENAESSLGDLIQAASEDHCRLEGNLIVADLSAEQFARLTGELKKVKALEILSRPRVTTIDGQKASLQVGGQVPLVRLEETVNGDPRRRVEFQNVGEMIVICPHLSDKDPSRLTLDIAATHTEVDKKAELRTGDDTPRFTTHQFKLAVEASVGKTLVVTEREPKKGSGRTNSILLAIGPQKLAPPVPEPAPPVATKATSDFGVPRNTGDKYKFTGDRDRLTMFVNTTRVVEFPLEVSRMLVKDPDLIRVVPLSPGSIQVSGLKPGTTQLSVWSAGDKPSSIDIVISNDIDGLRDENEELRKQIVDLQAKLIDLEVQIRWLRAAAAPGGAEKVSDQTFLRRVYLDLMGLLPTAEETKSFLNDKDPQKRDKLIDSLLRNAAKKEASSGRIKWKGAVASDPEAQSTTIKTAPKEKQKDPDSIQVFGLAHCLAADVAQVLAKVLPQAEGLTVGVDERTNSLILRGSPDAMQKAKALLEALDREVDFKPDDKEPDQQKTGALVRDQKLAELRATEAQFQRVQTAHNRNSASDIELNRAVADLKTAEINLEFAKNNDSIKLRKAQLQKAEAALRSAELALASAERLAAKGYLSKLELKAAKVTVDQKKAELNEARYNLKAIKPKE